MVPIHIMGNLTIPRDSIVTKRYMKLCFILYPKIVFLEPFNTVLYLFGPLKSSGSHNLVHTYQISAKIISLKRIFLRST